MAIQKAKVGRGCVRMGLTVLKCIWHFPGTRGGIHTSHRLALANLSVYVCPPLGNKNKKYYNPPMNPPLLLTFL